MSQNRGNSWAAKSKPIVTGGSAWHYELARVLSHINISLPQLLCRKVGNQAARTCLKMSIFNLAT